MNDKLNHLIVGTFTVLGTLCISSGLIMPNLVKFEKTNVGKLEVHQLRISNFKNNEVKLKDIEIEINNTLSLDVKDYLANPNDIEDSVIRRLKLDISNVNANEVGNYCIVGHNYRNGKMFGRLHELVNGDTVELEDLTGRKITYQVYNKYVVKPTDTRCTSQKTNGKKELTLITCTNYGKERLVVKCRQI